MRRTTRFASILLLASLGLLAAHLAPAALQAQQGRQRSDDFRITRDVNLVVLHATVLDQRGRFVADLQQEHFRVREDGVDQKLSLFAREDIPITVGLVIDNSGSMRVRRQRVNSAALTFVESSNRDDEVFVVNFSDDYYLDLDKDFTNNISELKEALERIDSRGSTRLYDSIIGSLDHLKKGTRDKKILLVVTDGEDNASEKSLAETVQEAQRSDAVIYAIGLLSEESRSTRNRARRALSELTEATGGLAFYPETVNDVESICRQIAHDIRNQYTLAYTPTNAGRDGTFRRVQVEVNAPRSYGRLTVRTRTGYFAKGPTDGMN